MARLRKRRDSWTEEEESLLRSLYPVCSKEEILLKIKRSWAAIYMRASSMGLKRDREIVKKEMIEGGREAPPNKDSWRGHEIEYLRKSYRRTSREEILKNLPERNWKTIRAKACRLGLQRDQDVIRKENVEAYRKAFKKKYGVESSFALQSVKEKIKKMHLKKRGTEYPMQSSEVKEKTRLKVQEKFGVDNTFQSEEIKLKIHATNMKKFGVGSPLQNPEIKKKVEKTCFTKYGVKNPFQDTDRVKEGMMKKYGVNYYLQSPEGKEAWIRTNRKKYGTDYPSQNMEVRKKLSIAHLSPEVKDKKYQSMLKKITSGERSFSVSVGEKKFIDCLLQIDPCVSVQIQHPETKDVMDYYLPSFNLYVQYDGDYWHGRNGVEGDGEQAERIRKTIEKDKEQACKIENLLRFWEKDIEEAVKEGNLLSLVRESVENKIGKIPASSHQHLRKLQLYHEDVKGLGFNPDNVKASYFDLDIEEFSTEIKEFIQRYEWLGTTGVSPKWCFVARYRDILSGVVLMNEPNAYSHLLGRETPKYEVIIQRGATISWAPRNLGSRLIMFACNWMISNTSKRLFIGYTDPAAVEIGRIYQACNFEYLGAGFGADYVYYHPEIGRSFSNHYFNRTSTLRRWCRENDIVFQKSWLNESGFKKLVAIPEELKEKYRTWKERILSEAQKKKVPRKGKYALILGKDKREKRHLEILKTYESLPYPKQIDCNIMAVPVTKTYSTADRKTSAKMEYIIKYHSELSRAELARNLNESPRWVKRQIMSLIKAGKITPKRPGRRAPSSI
jgi:hypothetical protein